MTEKATMTVKEMGEKIATVIRSKYPGFIVICGRLTCEALEDNLNGIFFGVYHNHPTVIILNYETNIDYIMPLTDYMKGWKL